MLVNTLKDLTGLKFGMLTVVSRGEDYVSPKGKRRPRWICQCECGGTTLVQSGTLWAGKVQSCGCLQKKHASELAIQNAHKRALNIAGERFGRLVAIKPVDHNSVDGYIWLCRCDCGSEVTKPLKRLRSGGVSSCGCLKIDTISDVNRKHSKTVKKPRLYKVWVGMRQRCNDPNHKSYANYGGRGIAVCVEWDDFLAFEEWAIANGYDETAPYGECTLDRIDVDGNYEPSNCRWVDSITQANNKRSTK